MKDDPIHIINNLLEKYKADLGTDFTKYKNHVYRVYFNCVLMDTDKENEEKYAIAAVFHDIGIWTDHRFDYLAPSIVQATNYLTETGKHNWTDEVSLMINWHHKLSRYKGAHERVVENFRKADWIDVSLGMLTFGNKRKEIRATNRKFPGLGFHRFLIKESIRNFFRHPLNPLPMFKK